MLNKNTISILRKTQPSAEFDYYLQFTGNGYIEIDELAPFLNSDDDFYFEIQFKVNQFPKEGYNFLMNSYHNVENNKIAIVISQNILYVYQVKTEGPPWELFIHFTDTSLDFDTIIKLTF